MAKTFYNNAFIMRKEQYEYIKPLTREERGDLVTAIFEYCAIGKTEQQLNDATLTAYKIITAQMEEDGRL